LCPKLFVYRTFRAEFLDDLYRVGPQEDLLEVTYRRLCEMNRYEDISDLKTKLKEQFDYFCMEFDV